jgi:hypothetical protein
LRQQKLEELALLLCFLRHRCSCILFSRLSPRRTRVLFSLASFA